MHFPSIIYRKHLLRNPSVHCHQSRARRAATAAPREISCARAANFYGFNKLMYNGISVEYLPVKARTSHNTKQSLSVQREEKLPSTWHTGHRSTQQHCAEMVLCFKNDVFSCVVLFPSPSICSEQSLWCRKGPMCFHNHYLFEIF